MENPIAFNPDCMTVSQLKECAETLRLIFDGLGRGVDADNIRHTLDQARQSMADRWAK